jgi:hypothetical protein
MVLMVFNVTFNIISAISWRSHMKRQVVLKVRRGRDRMVVGFTTICAINAYHHVSSNRRGEPLTNNH